MSESLRLVLTIFLILFGAKGAISYANLQKIGVLKINKITFQDTESCHAIGGLVPFIDSELFDLELISGISGSTANNLLSKRRDIIQRAAELPYKNQYQAFELAKGIGPKKAALLGKKFSLLEDTKSSTFRCLSQGYAQ